MENNFWTRSLQLPLFLLALIIFLVGAAGFFLGRGAGSTRSLASAPVFSDKSLGTQSCANKALALKISYPASWECNSQEISDLNGSINLTSPLFKVELGNIGHSSFCGSHPKDNKCTARPFYSNDLIELSLQKYDGVNKEIFGVIKPDYSGRSTWTWIKVNYNGMEERDLTADEKRELTSLLFSINLTK